MNQKLTIIRKLATDAFPEEVARTYSRILYHCSPRASYREFSTNK